MKLPTKPSWEEIGGPAENIEYLGQLELRVEQVKDDLWEASYGTDKALYIIETGKTEEIAKTNLAKSIAISSGRKVYDKKGKLINTEDIGKK